MKKQNIYQKQRNTKVKPFFKEVKDKNAIEWFYEEIFVKKNTNHKILLDNANQLYKSDMIEVAEYAYNNGKDQKNGKPFSVIKEELMTYQSIYKITKKEIKHPILKLMLARLEERKNIFEKIKLQHDIASLLLLQLEMKNKKKTTSKPKKNIKERNNEKRTNLRKTK